MALVAPSVWVASDKKYAEIRRNTQAKTPQAKTLAPTKYGKSRVKLAPTKYGKSRVKLAPTRKWEIASETRSYKKKG